MDGFFRKTFGSTIAAAPFSVLTSLMALLKAFSEAFSGAQETNANLLLNESLRVTDDVEGVLLDAVDDFGD